MENVLISHFSKYPLMRPQDAVKLCYQSEFGGGHMISDANAALLRLEEEIALTPQTGGALFEDIGDGLCRLRLCALRESGLRPETVNGLFLETVNRTRGSMAGMEAKLCTLTALASAGRAPFSEEELSEYLAEYRKAGCPAVSHTPAYRKAYAPAYRLVPSVTKYILPLLQKIDARIEETGKARIAIDGMSGSGKSTLGALLSGVYGASLFHMDDYFLPPDRKTQKRLSEPGGNVDWERFLAEIASRKTEEDVVYRPYICSEGALGEPIRIAANPVRIVEGSYSLRQPLFSMYDVRAFLYIDLREQSRRILSRNGSEMHKRFLSEWIPLENAYFDYARLEEKCDFALDTTNLPLI